jgi:hypothetical protein
MKILYAFVFLLLVSCRISAQDNASNFPQSFIGKWKGNLQWMVAGKPTQTFSMRLHVLTTDTAGIFTWKIIYGDKEQDSRPYLLKHIDTAKARWVIDENNGIVLDNYVFGNCLNGAFTVMGNTIVNSYCLENDKLKVTFSSIKLSDKKTTGIGTEDSPMVDSYRFTSYQTGILEKEE